MQADLFVLPTQSENFGIAIAEALAAGLPVITTKGAPWAGLHEKNCGWWIETNLEDLDETLLNAMNLPALELQEMGKRAKSWMQSEYSWQECGRKMSLAYDWLTGNADRPEWLYLN